MPEYRYTLTRDVAPLDTPRRRLCWVMLNPSTADDTKDDQTIRAIIKFTRREGYTDLVVVNLFAMRSTDPMQLLAVTADVARGVDNRRYIDEAIASSEAVVVAWGAWWATNVSDRKNLYPGLWRLNVEGMVRKAGKPLLCLGRTKGGHPRHPSRLADATPFEEFT